MEADDCYSSLARLLKASEKVLNQVVQLGMSGRDAACLAREIDKARALLRAKASSEAAVTSVVEALRGARITGSVTRTPP